MARLTKAQQAERQESIERLREQLPPGTTVYTILRHKAASGMMRTIQTITLTPNGEGGVDRRYLGYHVARVLGLPYDNDREGIKVGGAGMDMGFHIVNELSYALHGYEREQVPGWTPQADADKSPHWHDKYSPGYTLNHEWL